MPMRWLVPVCLATLAGCAFDASVRVVTTARERCEWQERVLLGAGADRFRVPANAATGGLVVQGRRLRVVGPGTLIRVLRSAAEDRTKLVVDGVVGLDILPRSASVAVEWVVRTDETITAERLFPVPEELPWTIDWEFDPTPKRVHDGECRISDVKTEVWLVGSDAHALVLDVTVEGSHVKGEVRRRDAER